MIDTVLSPSSHTNGAASTAIIQVQDVRKRFGRKMVLRQVNLAVGQGEVVALLGPNGAGKTTMMRIIAGLSRPDRGEVLLGNVPLGQVGHELRRYIGLVSHAPLLYDGLSGLENLSFFARIYDMQEPADRIEAVLRQVDLWTRRHDPVRTYSRGMVQRLAIGRAILHDPPVLLLDEPDTGLDQTSVAMLQSLVRELGGAKRAILLTTHNLDRALAWSDRICLLDDGEIAVEKISRNLDGEGLHTLYEQQYHARL